MQLIWSQNMTITNRQKRTPRNRLVAVSSYTSNGAKIAQLWSMQAAALIPMMVTP